MGSPAGPHAVALIGDIYHPAASLEAMLRGASAGVPLDWSFSEYLSVVTQGIRWIARY